jgi:hypothetical protein
MIQVIRRSLSPMDDDELKDEVAKSYPEPYRAEDSSGNGDGGGDGNSPDKEPDYRRSEYWFEETEEQVSQNTKITQENRKLLARIDERTALLARIVFVVILGGTVTIIAAQVGMI